VWSRPASVDLAAQAEENPALRPGRPKRPSARRHTRWYAVSGLTYWRKAVCRPWRGWRNLFLLPSAYALG